MSKSDDGAEKVSFGSEQELRLLMETIPAFVWRAGPEGDIEYANKRLLEYFGTPLGDIISRGWAERVHPDDVAFKTKAWLRNLDSGTPQDAVCRFRGSDGRYRWFLVSGAPLKAGDGRALRWYGVLTDIDDRRKAAETFRESEYKLRQIIDKAPGHTWSADSDNSERMRAKDPSGFMAQLQAILNVLPAYTWYAAPRGALTFVNNRTAEYLGVPKDDPLRFGIDVGAEWDHAFALLHPDDREDAGKYWSSRLSTGEGGEHSYRVRSAQGDYRWFLTRMEPLRAGDGTLLLWIGATLDIEELKRADEGLRESERSARSALDGIAGLITVNDSSGKLETVNRQVLEYFGRPLEWLKNWGTNDAVHPEDFPRILELYTKATASGIPFNYEVRLRRFDGEYRWFDNRGVPIRDDSGRIVRWYVLLTDIEDRARALARLDQMQSDFAHMNRLSVMGELTASLAHEITQPIASARNNARAALNFLDMQPPDLDEVRDAVHSIVGDADRARDIIDRIRDHIKKAPPRKCRFDLNEAINEVILLARSAITINGVSVRTYLTEAPFPVEGDRVQLQQVVLNLVLNAIEAMSAVEAAARELSISTMQAETDGVIVSVQDSGPGIDPGHLNRVFQAFYTTKPSGIGMGLSICRSIIDAHRGRLWADVNVPRGVVFRFSLPGVGGELTSSSGSAMLGGEPHDDIVSDGAHHSGYEGSKRPRRAASAADKPEIVGIATGTRIAVPGERRRAKNASGKQWRGQGAAGR
jgi:PAS domain S-box-containing protein